MLTLDADRMNEVNSQVDAVLSQRGSSLEGAVCLPLAYASYYPCRTSLTRLNPDFRQKEVEFLIGDEQYFNSATVVDGDVIVYLRKGPLFVAELDIRHLHAELNRRGTYECLVKHKEELGLPNKVFAPYQHFVVGVNQPGTALYTQDYEGSGWSLHLAR